MNQTHRLLKTLVFMQHLHGTECFSIFIFKLDLNVKRRLEQDRVIASFNH